MTQLLALVLCFLTILVPAVQAAGGAEEIRSESAQTAGQPVVPELPVSALENIPAADSSGADLPSLETQSDLGEPMFLGLPQDLKSVPAAKTRVSKADTEAAAAKEQTGRDILQLGAGEEDGLSTGDFKKRKVLNPEQDAEALFDGALKGRAQDNQAPAFDPRPVDEAGSVKGSARKSGEYKPAIAGRFIKFLNPKKVSRILSYDQNALFKVIKHDAPDREGIHYWRKFKTGDSLKLIKKAGGDETADEGGSAKLEMIYGKPVKIVRAVTKSIASLTKADFRGDLRAVELRDSIGVLRARLKDYLAKYNRTAERITLETKVRIIEWKSALDLFKEANKGRLPKAEPKTPPTPRNPMLLKPEGSLEYMTRFLPSVVFMDVDSLGGTLSDHMMSDIRKLQNMGVWFVAVSRKSMDDSNSAGAKVIKQMVAKNLTWHFASITDDGAVISAFPNRNGKPMTLDVQAFSQDERWSLEDAAKTADLDAGINSRQVKRIFSETQLPKADRSELPIESIETTGATSLDISFPRGTDQKKLEAWTAAFNAQLKDYRLGVQVRQGVLADGRMHAVVRKTTLGGSLNAGKSALGHSLKRLSQALALRGLHYNPSGILVLSSDPSLQKANSNYNFARLAAAQLRRPLQGRELVEQATMMMLGEFNTDSDLDIVISPSAINNFLHYREEFNAKELHPGGGKNTIVTFGGTVVHGANEWLIAQLQHRRRPSQKAYAEELSRSWDESMAQPGNKGFPSESRKAIFKRSYINTGLGMYDLILRSYDSGEIPVATEVPGFIILKEYAKKTGKLKTRVILRIVRDFIALRDDPEHPGKKIVVTYDFKTGDIKTRQEMMRDLQAGAYYLSPELKWNGKPFPLPYFSGKPVEISGVAVKFWHGEGVRPLVLDNWDLDKIKKNLISKSKQVNKAKKELQGLLPKKAHHKKSARKGAKASKKGKKKK